MRSSKAQSAMEYVTQYGWAIIILALVIGALFWLGLFNANPYSAKLKAGGCQVYRPNGPESIAQIALVGICDDVLPQYTLVSKGIGDYVLVNNSDTQQSPLDITGPSITITAWVYILGSPYHDVVDKEGQYGLKLDYENSPHACSPSNNPGLCLEWDTYNDWTGVSYPIPNGTFNKWIFIAATMNATTKAWYADGAQIGTEPITGNIEFLNSNTVIGAISPYNNYGYGYGGAEWFNGSISNVQIYNATLSTNEINSMYHEGLGGVPIRLQNLVAWYPLNANPVDYSGDNLNGYIVNDIYTGGSWSTQYGFQVGN